MVATDIAARGIDVTRISHVINYDMPSTTDAYTHRIGRTGRAAKTGDAFTFVTGEDAGLAHSLKRVLGEKLEYHSVAGLTTGMPVDNESPALRNSSGRKMKPNNGRKLFSPKPRTNSRPKQRSFDASNRSQWAH
jgi:ATP-dependent RNA helicase RhlE